VTPKDVVSRRNDHPPFTCDRTQPGRECKGDHLMLVAYRLDVLQYIADIMGLDGFDKVKAPLLKSL